MFLFKILLINLITNILYQNNYPSPAGIVRLCRIQIKNTKDSEDEQTVLSIQACGKLKLKIVKVGLWFDSFPCYMHFLFCCGWNKVFLLMYLGFSEGMLQKSISAPSISSERLTLCKLLIGAEYNWFAKYPQWMIYLMRTYSILIKHWRRATVKQIGVSQYNCSFPLNHPHTTCLTTCPH